MYAACNKADRVLDAFPFAGQLDQEHSLTTNEHKGLCAWTRHFALGLLRSCRLDLYSSASSGGAVGCPLAVLEHLAAGWKRWRRCRVSFRRNDDVLGVCSSTLALDLYLTRYRGVFKAWTGLIRMDGTAYTWMGLPSPTAINQTAFEYTSTKSIFTLDIGGFVEMNVIFTSPIAPNDMKRQSMVKSYMDVSVVAKNGGEHDIQLYADVTGGQDFSNSPIDLC